MNKGRLEIFCHDMNAFAEKRQFGNRLLLDDGRSFVDKKVGCRENAFLT